MVHLAIFTSIVYCAVSSDMSWAFPDQIMTNPSGVTNLFIKFITRSLICK